MGDGGFGLSATDVIVMAGYALVILGLGWWVSRQPAGHTQTSADYFLAGRALPWWAIGASLIAANISAEQIIGQSGQGFVVGLAIAAYEWQAALVLLIVAKFFLPIFLARGISTMPQFLDQRFGGGVKTLMSVYWIVLYTAVNLTTVLWLGGLAAGTLTGLPVMVCMLGLAGFAILYSLGGGLKAVALTDLVQVVVLVLGGLGLTWLSLTLVGGDGGAGAGLSRLMGELPGHFRMILSEDHPAYVNLPGIWTLLGGLWVLHFSYWGFNQYIIQRALGASSIAEAQQGLVFAAFLKLLIPVFVVLPGIAAVVLAAEGKLGDVDLATRPDGVYGALMVLAPEGLRGLVFAALVAAIVSSLASMVNSIATIFTLDLYRPARPNRTETHYVRIGQLTALVAMGIALALAEPFLSGAASGFEAIHE
jgi:SSS family solute:Na+ symporter